MCNHELETSAEVGRLCSGGRCYEFSLQQKRTLTVNDNSFFLESHFPIWIESDVRIWLRQLGTASNLAANYGGVRQQCRRLCIDWVRHAYK